MRNPAHNKREVIRPVKVSRQNMRTIPEIDALRKEAGLTRKALYERAAVHHSTYGRNLRRTKGSPLASTVQRLDRALDALTAERAQYAEAAE